MHQKTEAIEKPYSREQIKRIKKAFSELKRFKGSPEVEAFTRKLERGLKG